MAETHTVAPGEAAHALLREIVAAAKGADPLTPVTVAVPSNYAGLATRRRLAWDSDGLVNIRFLVLDRVAELLGAPALATTGRRPLTGAVRAEAVRAELRAAPGSFRIVAAHHATERSLERAFTELRGCEPDVLDRLSTLSPRAADVVRLFRAWRSRLGSGWYDEHDLADAAADAVHRQAAACADIGHLVVFLPRRLTPAQRRLVAAFGDGASVVEADLDAVPVRATGAISAPDADDEVRAAVRAVAERLQRGIPLHRMALLYGASDPYARLVGRQLDSARIPWNGPAVRTLAETITGRALLGLLTLSDRGWQRGDVVAWLSAAPVLGEDKRPVPAARWDALSREAGITAGQEQWESNLAELAARKAETADGADPEDPEWLVQRLRDDGAQLDALRLFVAELVAAAAPPGSTGLAPRSEARSGPAPRSEGRSGPAPRSEGRSGPAPRSEGRSGPGDRVPWELLAAWADTLLHRYLGDEIMHGSWPDLEQAAWQSVRDALRNLADLDVMGEATDLTTFRRAVERELDVPVSRGVGTFGDGLLVAPIHVAAGLDVDVVLVLGMSEGIVPGRTRIDALLPERERDAAGGALIEPSRPVDDAHDALRHALAAARQEQILLCPRADLRRGRAHLPSRWFLAAVERPDGGVLDVVPSFEGGLAGATVPAALHERDLRELLAWQRAGGEIERHPMVRNEPALAAGLDAEHSRRSAAFTPFDGRVPAGAVTVPGEGPVSPTSLESYAICPRRYLMARVLRVAAVEKPEQITRLSPRDRGTLIHEILERFIQGVLDGGPRSLDRLLALADEVGGSFQQAGLTGKRLLWSFDLRRIRRELTRLHAEDRLDPLAAEMSFGVRGEPPVLLDAGDRQLAFRGMIDRVDRSPDGAVVVTDYKTGSSWPYARLADDPVDRGTKLQLAVYGLAARQRFPATEVRSRYWFITEKANFAEVGYVVDDAVVARLATVVGRAVDGITAGVFPARPGEADPRGGWANCLYCDYDRLCPRDRGRQWERKRSAPELVDYVALSEGDSG